MPRNKKVGRYISHSSVSKTKPTNKFNSAKMPDLLLLSKNCNNTTSIGIICLLLLLNNLPVVLAQCEPPQGSYLDTCKVSGSVYRSSDSNLAKIDMCKYEMSCKALNGNSVQNTFYVQRSMARCLTFFENCNGQLVVRNSNERVCTTEDVIKSESNYKVEL